MDNGRLLHDAWRLTWRHRFLWVLGLFAGGGTGLNFSFPGGGAPHSAGGGPLPPEASRVLDEVNAWVVAHLGLLLALAAVLALVGIVFLVIHFIAQGAMIGALGRLAAGEPIMLGGAWALGRRLAWRYVRLALLLLALALAALLVVAVVVGALVALGQASPALAIALGLFLVGALVLGVPFFVGLYILAMYAERAIAIEDLMSFT